MATIRDVAALAGVSTATVSRVMNGRIRVPDRTRQKIDEAVQKLDYKPNYLARGLVLKETRTIGLIIPDILNPYFPGVARGVEHEARRAGWSVLLCNSDNLVDKELSYIQLLQYKHIDGIILVSSGQTSKQLRALLEQNIPVVLAGRRIQGVRTDSVAIANAKGAYEATRHLIELGHTHIAMICGNASIRTSRERLEGYRRALSQAGIPLDEKLVADGDYQYQGGHDAMKRLLLNQPRPTALFAANDLMALGAIKAIQDAGLSVPGDLGVVGFDDIPLSSIVRPQLTTMSVSPYRIGEIACYMLLDRIERKENPKPRLKVMDARLVIRESCGADNR